MSINQQGHTRVRRGSLSVVVGNHHFEAAPRPSSFRINQVEWVVSNVAVPVPRLAAADCASDGIDGQESSEVRAEVPGMHKVGSFLAA